MKELQSVNKYIWKYKHILLLGLVFTACSNFLGSLLPKVVSDAINFAEHGQNTTFAFIFSSGTHVQTGITKAAVVIILLAIGAGFFLFLMRKTIIVASHKIVADIRSDLYHKYQQLDQSFYKQNRTGDLMSRLTEDISNVRMYLGPAIMYFANTIAMFVFYIYQMIKADALLTFWTLLPLPFLSISIYFVSSIIFKKTQYIQKKLSGLTTFAQESYSGIRVIKSYAREQSFGKQFEQECEDYKTDSLSLAQVEAFFFPLMLLLIGTSIIIAIYVGGMLVEQGLIQKGTIVQFIIYVGKLTWPVTSLGWIASIVQKAAASQARINEFMLREPAIADAANTIPLPEQPQQIEFKNVSFTYPETGIQALKHISFVAKTNQKIAIIGRTGSGKTTLADLLLRVYEPDEGEILLNGVNIQQLPLEVLRKTIGYVPQDIFLFSDTIEKNISIAQPESTLSQIKDVAMQAAVAKDIKGFDLKYQTRIGERGVNLSGGQKQRISIARAILHNPSFLILDDALSAVDAETEKEIQDAFDTVFKDKTVLVITHRVFTLFDVDQILVLENGMLAQKGSHEELLRQEGPYKELHEMND